MPEISEKELKFQEEYTSLLQKYNVKLVLEVSSGEYGYNVTPIYEECSRYRNISFVPKYTIHDIGRTGMGG